jgi:Ca2+:H+ antiporter
VAHRGFSDRRSRPFRINVFITLAVRERADATSSSHGQAPSYAAASAGTRERAPSTTSKPVVGIVIAALALLPEGLAALRAARANQLQTSLNLALGSALASIGLTIPVVAGVSIVICQPLELGLGTKDEVLLALMLLTGVITLGTGRTTVLQGIVHLVIFAVFLFFAMVP